MKELIINTIIMISMFLIVLGIAYLAWIASCMFVNIKVLGETFDFWRFVKGILKGIVYCLSFYLFAIAVAMIPVICEEYGLLAEGLADTINIISVTSILLTVTYKKLKETFENWKLTFNLTDAEIEELKVTKKA